MALPVKNLRSDAQNDEMLLEKRLNTITSRETALPGKMVRENARAETFLKQRINTMAFGTYLNIENLDQQMKALREKHRKKQEILGVRPNSRRLSVTSTGDETRTNGKRTCGLEPEDTAKD